MAETKKVKKPKRKTAKKTGVKKITNKISDVFEPIEESIEKKVVANKQKTVSLGTYKKIAISFVVLTIALVALVFYFSFARVSILLIPNQERISDLINVNVYDQSQEKLAGAKDVVGSVKQIEISLSKEYQATNREVLGEEVIGKIIIINKYIKNQPLVATTRLLSQDGKLFRLKNTVNVPAGGQIEVEVYADEPNTEMAIGPTTFTIPGLWAGLQDKIYGKSEAKMVYSEKVKIKIQQSDIDSAVKDLKDMLLEKTKNDIGDAYKNYDQVLYEVDNNSIKQELDGKVGEEKPSFNLSMKTKVTIVAFGNEKIVDMANQKFALAIPDDREVIDLIADDFSYNLLNCNIEKLTAAVRVQVMAKTTIKDETNIVDREKLVGLTEAQLNEYLNNLPEIAGFEAKFFPSFVQKVPSLVDRIKIEIKK